MSQPLVVSIPHRLGRQEARRRLESGIGRIRPELAGLVNTLDYSWDGDNLNFHTVAMWQTITGRIEVLEDAVRIEIEEYDRISSEAQAGSELASSSRPFGFMLWVR